VGQKQNGGQKTENRYYYLIFQVSVNFKDSGMRFLSCNRCANMNILKVLIIEKQNGVLKTGSSFNFGSRPPMNEI
jgi:hypothetical protein